MRLFSQKLEKAFPITEKIQHVSRNGIVKHMVKFKNNRKTDWSAFSIPYVEEVIAYLQKKRGYVPKRVLFVCEDENVAVKSAAYIKEHYEEFKINIDDFYGDYEDFDGDDEEGEKNYVNMLRVIPLLVPVTQEKSGFNNYIPYLHDVNSEDVVLFQGLSKGNDIKEKIEAIGACPADVQCIQIRPDQLTEPWVQELLIDYNCDVLPLSDLGADYYENVLKYLLQKEEYKLAAEITPKMLVRKISKRRGRLFKEEDLAWYLDKAAEHAQKHHPKSKKLCTEDFGGLALGEEKTLHKLMGMTGLKTVKEMAGEAAALAHEEMHNQSLENLHKNMLFMGNPGTGKTTCAKMLADIMAEEGTSNAVFVSASRSDLIGEYVGHTSPKVAAKFEEARGGILFVDEAGFFLNQNSGGYVMEALKEFVRYMELYPDVTVIFAMYPKEAKVFLNLDEGLSSRISRFVTFEDYSTRELCDITESMLQKNGYSMDEAAKEVVCSHMEQLRRENKADFGNAREARRLAESAVITISVAHYQKKGEGNVISAEDMQAACERLLRKENYGRRSFGFSNC